MPIIVRWYDEAQAIMITDFVGDWTWDEYGRASQGVVELLSQPDIHFDLINDFRQSQSVPKGDLMHSIGTGVNITTYQLDMIVAIQPPPLLQSVIEMLKHSITRPKRVVVNTIEEALAAIAQHRQADDSN